MELKTTKPGKNEFKCFHCRKVVAKRDGDWHRWADMEVHLCRPCDRSTSQSSERKGS